MSHFEDATAERRFKRFLSLCDPGFPADMLDELVDGLPGAPTWYVYIHVYPNRYTPEPTKDPTKEISEIS